MRIALAQLNYFVGDFEGNYAKMASAIEEAIAADADLVVFSELAVCGYPARDFLDFKHFTRQSMEIVHRLAQYAGNRIAVLVGSPSFNPNKEGKDLYNSAFFLENGQVKHEAHKALLPTYDVFDEYRYFEPNKDFRVVNFKGKRLAITICEDIWNIGNENPLYTVCPMDEMMAQHPDILINLSASPFSYTQAKTRIEIVRANALRYKVPVLYCNQVGAQTELLFDGGSLVVDASGMVRDELPYFKQEVCTYDIDAIISSVAEEDIVQPKEQYALMHDALVMGIRDYFAKLGFKKAILGLSGGVDSAITLVLAAEALGKDNVLPVLMPSQFSSEHSISDSLQLVENLGCDHKIIPIKEVFDAYMAELEPHFAQIPFNITEENLQARIRANYLMALSNKFGYILLNTSNKSEAAVGYGTLYGDMCGGLSVIGDVYKTQVYLLCDYVNRNGEIIPRNILTKAPSAELRPNQKDSDSLPEYDILDPVLFEYIENKHGPDEIIAKGYDEALVKRVLRMVNRTEFKRHQTPPILRVSSKAFGVGRRLPIVGHYLE